MENLVTKQYVALETGSTSLHLNAGTHSSGQLYNSNNNNNNKLSNDRGPAGANNYNNNNNNSLMTHISLGQQQSPRDGLGYSRHYARRMRDLGRTSKDSWIQRLWNHMFLKKPMKTGREIVQNIHDGMKVCSKEVCDMRV